MFKVVLDRVCYTDQGTFGVLLYEDIPLCVTCELPWRKNQRKISCIPIGSYECNNYTHIKHKNIWKLEDVPNRDGILIHVGNTIKDIEGCILVGQFFTTIKDLPAIGNSANTLKMLKERLPETFTLVIRD